MTERYELECTDCGFRTTVVGELDVVHEEAATHRREHQANPDGHFVNVHRLDR